MLMEFRKIAVLALAVGAAGCSSKDLEVSEVANTSAALSGALVREVGDATTFVNDLTALASAINTAGSLVPTTGGAGGAGAPAAPAPVGDLPPSVALRAAAPFLTAIQPAATTQNPLLSAGRWLANTVVAPAAAAPADQAATDLETFLKTRVFTEANYESGDADSAVFLLHGSQLCTDGTYTPLPSCVTQVDDLQLRIKATKAGGGFDFDFLLGPARANPVSLGLQSGSASITFDLGGIKAAANFVADLSNKVIDLPNVMVGQIRLALTKIAENHMKLAISIPQKIQIQVVNAAGTYDFSTDVTATLLGVEADASVAGSGVLSAIFGLGRTTFSLPYSDFQPGVLTNFTTFGIDLGGLSSTVTARQDASTQMVVSNVGLGSTKTRLFAKAGAAADVNGITAELLDGAGAATTFAVTVTDDGVNAPTIGLTPFELSVYVGLGLFDLPSPVLADSGAFDDAYSITVGADTLIVEPPLCDLVTDPACVEADLALGGGSLTFEATPGTFSAATGFGPVTVDQCLYSNGTDPNVVFGLISAGACPVPAI
jgi:hypothetical protein